MLEEDYEMNRYLLSSTIIISVFIILSVIIYTDNTFDSYGNSFNGISVYEIDNSNLQIYDTLFSKIVTPLMKLLSDYGREYFWIAILVMMFIIGGPNGRMAGITILIAFIIIVPLNIIIKDVIDKDRPSTYNRNLVEEIPLDKSYPSGHASMVSAGALSVVIYFRKSLSQKLLASFLVMEAGLVCISRLYLGVHYPLDIVGGVLLGTGISLLVASNHKIWERLVKKL